MFTIAKKTRRDKNIMLPVTNEEHIAIKKMAADRGLKITDMLRIIIDAEYNHPVITKEGKAIQQQMFTREDQYKKALAESMKK